MNVRQHRVRRGVAFVVVAPQHLDEASSRDHLARLREQHREQTLLLRTADPDEPVAVEHLDRAENSVPHREPPAAELYVTVTRANRSSIATAVV